MTAAVGTGPADLGYGGAPVARFGIIYEAQHGGSGWGVYCVVDRVLGFRTAWRIFVDPGDSDRMTAWRVRKLRDLVAGENERWAERSERERAMVLEGGPDGRAAKR